MYGSISEGKIAVAGLSLGGLTSLLTTYHGDLRDPRVAAAICIAGPTNLFAPEFYAGNDVPLLMVYGDADSMVLYDDHAMPAFEMAPGATLVTLRKASHTGFAQPASTFLRFMKNPDSFACRAITLGMASASWSGDDYIDLFGGREKGVVPMDEVELRTTPLVPVSMKAARQQMFTSLSAHAFLESLFAEDASIRNASRNFLVKTMPWENSREVAVSH
jgi:hypothetical protein